MCQIEINRQFKASIAIGCVFGKIHGQTNIHKINADCYLLGMDQLSMYTFSTLYIAVQFNHWQYESKLSLFFSLSVCLIRNSSNVVRPTTFMPFYYHFVFVYTFSYSFVSIQLIVMNGCMRVRAPTRSFAPI